MWGHGRRRWEIKSLRLPEYLRPNHGSLLVGAVRWDRNYMIDLGSCNFAIRLQHTATYCNVRAPPWSALLDCSWCAQSIHVYIYTHIHTYTRTRTHKYTHTYTYTCDTTWRRQPRKWSMHSYTQLTVIIKYTVPHDYSKENLSWRLCVSILALLGPAPPGPSWCKRHLESHGFFVWSKRGRGKMHAKLCERKRERTIIKRCIL